MSWATRSITRSSRRLFEKFKILADKKKVIKDRDLEGLIGAVPVSGEERYTLDRFVINSGNTITSTAVIRVKKGDEMFERAAASDGPINAIVPCNRQDHRQGPDCGIPYQ
mgnify:CR=1 FL=1